MPTIGMRMFLVHGPDARVKGEVCNCSLTGKYPVI